MLMPHAGLDISDDGIRCLAYAGSGHDRHISLHDSVALPPGLLRGGDCKNEKELVSRLADFGRRNGLSYVKVSIPEEKAYLFQTDVPDLSVTAINQNIESKLEENVPLAAPDAIFYFDVLDVSSASGVAKASVTVTPRTYIEHYMSLLDEAGLIPVAFETAPKAVSRAVVPESAAETRLIVHVMDHKSGLYIVSGNVVCFASTVAVSGTDAISDRRADAVQALSKEIGQVCSYWASHGIGRTVSETVIVGCGADAFREVCRTSGPSMPAVCRIADVWTNTFDVEKQLPSISQEDSLLYAVAAGLAFELSSEI